LADLTPIWHLHRIGDHALGVVTVRSQRTCLNLPHACSCTCRPAWNGATRSSGRRINSATLVADARHSWLDAMSSAGALAGLVGVLLGASWADPVAGLAVTVFICHVGWDVTTDVAHRLLDGVDPAVITAAEAAAGSVPGVLHAHARARWTGRTLGVEIEGWVDAAITVADADAPGRLVADRVAHDLPQARSLTWTARAV
jgi:divalent metal cation (Fe/Co/Zn/Cd) transporter